MKYGIENFEFSILEKYNLYEPNLSKILNEREEYWIRELDTIVSHNKGYNLTYGGKSNRPSEETKAKISKALKELPRTPEWSRNIGIARKGVPCPKVSIAQKGISVPSRGKKGKRNTCFNKRIKITNRITGEVIVFDRQSDCCIYLYGYNRDTSIKKLLDGFIPRYKGKTFDIYKKWKMEFINTE
jgi:hypothetical protein